MLKEISGNSKDYIIMGQECPICMESITNNVNAWKTKCGHTFHKKCLMKYYDIIVSRLFRCPCCRAEMEDFDYWATDVYYDICYSSKNHLDQIHYLELYKDMIPQNICEECDNIIGFTKHCFGCKDWRWSPNVSAILRSKYTDNIRNENITNTTANNKT
jgi:hypothetical protein